MKKAKSSITKAIAVLAVLFSANLIKAQTLQVVPYPNSKEGQELKINSSSPDWQALISWG